jgi:hypothetical protein
MPEVKIKKGYFVMPETWLPVANVLGCARRIERTRLHKRICALGLAKDHLC